MKTLLYIIILLIFSGCNMQRYCNKRYPPEIITEVHEVVRDSIITIEIKPDTLKMTDTVFVEKGLAYMPLKRLDTEFCYSTSWIHNSRHFFELHQKAAKIDTIIKYREKYVTETVKVPEHYITWWDGFWIRLGRIFIAALIVIIAVRLIKRF